LSLKDPPEFIQSTTHKKLNEYSGSGDSFYSAQDMTQKETTY